METITGMPLLRPLAFMIILTTLHVSCTKDKDDDIPNAPIVEDTITLLLKFNATANDEPLDFQKAFTDPLNRSQFVELFKYYVSNISLVQGENAIPVWQVGLIIHEDKGESSAHERSNKIALKAPAGNYSGIRFGLGLDAETDKRNPAEFQNWHPLSSAQGTYWDSWNKYRFVSIEGRADIDGDSVYTDIYGYHTGFDTCYRELSFSKSFHISKGSITRLEFTIEINDIFFGNDTLDFAAEPDWHGAPETISRAIRISDNFAHSMKIL